MEAIGKRAVIDPNTLRSIDGDSVPMAYIPIATMFNRVTNQPSWAGDNVPKLDPLDDNVVDIVDCDPRAVLNDHFSPTSIDGLVAVHDELLFEPNGHALLKSDP